MAIRTPLRERVEKIKSRQLIAYMIKGVDDSPRYGGVTDTERLLNIFQQERKLNEINMNSGMSQEEIKQTLNSFFDGGKNQVSKVGEDGDNE